MQKHFLLLFLFLLAFLFDHKIQAQKLDTTNWVTDGAVNAIHREGNTLYLGGSFKGIGQNTGNGAMINSYTQELKAPNMRVAGEVRACVPDKKGGYFIAGGLTKVGGFSREMIAHIDSNGKVTNWKASVVGTYVLDMCLGDNNTLYIAGSFWTVNGQARTSVAALDATSGALLQWNPQVHYNSGAGFVTNLALKGDTLFMAGSITDVNSVVRTNLAAVSASTGNLIDWSYPATSDIEKLYVHNNVLYVGGSFTAFNGQPRTRLAAIDIPTQTLTSLAPQIYSNPTYSTSSVYEIYVKGNDLYFGGNFKSVDNSSRKFFASIDITTGILNSWNPVVPFNQYTASCITDSVIYVGGDLNEDLIQTFRMGKINIATAAVSVLPHRANNFITIMQFNGKSMYIGGFSMYRYLVRRGLAAIDVGSGLPLSWDPKLAYNGNPPVVNTFKVVNNSVMYIGGTFSFVGGNPKSQMAALDLPTGNLLTNWAAPTLAGTPMTIVEKDGTLFTGGDFGIKALSTSTGQSTSWAPQYQSGGSILDIVLSGDSMIIGGTFSMGPSASFRYLASLNCTTGLLSSWNPGIDAYGVYDMMLKDSILYVGGGFSFINGISRNQFAGINIRTGALTPLTIPYLGSVGAMNYAGNKLYISGNPGVSGSATLMVVNEQTGIRDAWYPAINGVCTNAISTMIRSILLFKNSIYLGGDISDVNGFSIGVGGWVMLGEKALLRNKISGKVYREINEDCVQNPGENPIIKSIVWANPGHYFSSTDQNGNYSLTVDTATYQVSPVISVRRAMMESKLCPQPSGTHQITFSKVDVDSTNVNFGNKFKPCSLLSVDLSSDRRRACFKSLTTIQYCNEGVIDASNVELKVIYPDYTFPISSTLPWDTKIDSVLIYNLGTVPAGFCGTFVITDSVACSRSILNLTQCTKAFISPRSDCVPDNSGWDKSSIKVTGSCVNGYARFQIKNGGSGDMTSSHQYRVYFNDVLGYNANFKLNSGESLIVNVRAQGRTIRLEADQDPLHPGKSRPQETVEGCGASIPSLASTGFIATVPPDNQDPENAVSCIRIIGSFDPNDKQVSPIGIGNDHYIKASDGLEYLIRFQNTGTDTAYTVVVSDTLSEDLDIQGFIPGVSSHPCSWKVTGEGKPVITWTFENINLPDSTVNLQQSMGFVKFKIDQAAGNPAGTVIKNKANIFFDYNEPVITNETRNVIGPTEPVNLSLGSDVFEGMTTGIKNSQKALSYSVFPNPFTQTTQFELKENTGNARLVISDLSGHEVFNTTFTGTSYQLEKGELKSGIYMYQIQTGSSIAYGKIVII
jgi:uncharacterized repeat protein (TIGR01451 family)